MAALMYSLHPVLSFLASFLLCLFYVFSLYIKNGTARDTPEGVKLRFVRVAVVSICSIPYVWFFGSADPKGFTLWEWLGIRFGGLITSLVLPLFLTMLLFSGPLLLLHYHGVFAIYQEKRYWTTNVTNVYWLRNHVVGPVTEEFVFRACMMPLLVPTFGVNAAIVMCPLFFGIAHFHHMLHKVKVGRDDVKTAFLTSLFQFSYTTVFGVYAAFLFIRTGHLIGPILAHAFCNHMGFPNVDEVLNESSPERKSKLVAAFFFGFLAFCSLLYPLTSPWLYGNRAYWNYL